MNAQSISRKVADSAFELRVMRDTGMIGGLRPDRAARVLATLRRGGATPASAIRIARIKRPDSEYIVDEIGSLTFAEVDRRTNALARAFAARGVEPGERIALMCRNHRGFIESNLAASKLGATVIFLNTMFSGPQLAEVVEREDPKLLVADEEFSGLLSGIPETVTRVCGFAERRDTGRIPDRFVAGLDQLIAGEDDSDLPLPDRASRYVILTSGTTGTPKGAQRSSPEGLGMFLALLDRVPHRSGQTMVMAAPMFHSWGFINSVIGLSLGARLVMDRRFDPARTMELVDRHRAEVLVAVPVMLQRILELDEEDSRDFRAGQLRITTLSGSALPGGLATRWMDRYGDNLYSLYGSTEVAFASIAGPEDLRDDPATAGWIPRGTTIRLVGDDGREVARGETGRIFISNEMVFEGYTGGKDKERLDGFVSSGDIGHFDQSGRLVIDGRDDEMIVSGGENIFPAEVEDLIAGHIEVEEVAVIGVEDERFGQALRAFVVLRRQGGIDEPGIRSFVKANLASYKTPRDVVFVAELPRNATGKIVKRELA
ncbi:MAG: AMP-binding protein [Solirubrobacterales bacterium]|nr:AMP-binding protein [Solirubrobacterales bacterium]